MRISCHGRSEEPQMRMKRGKTLQVLKNHPSQVTWLVAMWPARAQTGSCGLVGDLLILFLPGQSCSRLTWTLLQNPPGPGILLAKALGAVRAFVELRSRPGVIPLSDGFADGINKLTHPVRRLHFSSQRRGTSSSGNTTSTLKCPRGHKPVPSCLSLLRCSPVLVHIWCTGVCGGGGRGGGASFSYFSGGGPTVKHIKFDHLSPGSSPRVAWLSIALWHRRR